MKNFSLRAGRFLTLALLLIGLGLNGCKSSDDTTVYGDWVPSSTYTGPGREQSVSFVINGVAYAGTGRNSSNTPLNDFYSFDPTKGGWAALTPMPAGAVARYGAAAFTANNKGYVGTGRDINGNYLSDFWEFDPSKNTTTTTTTTSSTGVVTTTTTTTTGSWRQVASLTTTAGSTGRSGAVANSINNVGFVGCGTDGNNNLSDFYKYDATNNRWTAFSAPFPGGKRVAGVSFVLNNQMYVTGGTNNNISATDMYAYDPATDSWGSAKRYLRNVSNSTESYDYSGVARAYAVAFTVNGKAYLTTGGSTLLTCYEYDPIADTWTLKNPFNGSARNYAVGFGIGNYGYVGLGINGSTRLDDFFRFDPNAAQE